MLSASRIPLRTLNQKRGEIKKAQEILGFFSLVRFVSSRFSVA
jgi:hypothetical protein